MKTRYLLIGNGIAALSAAKILRKKEPEASITLVSRESAPTYYRIRLTEAIANEQQVEDLYVEKPAFYKEQRLHCLLHTEVERIDYAKKIVHCHSSAGSQTIAYEKLLLATGATPFLPPYEGTSEGVYSIRRIEDVEALRSALPKARSALVVGGGLLGLEAAYALHQRGLDVHLCEFAPHLLNRQLDAASSERLEADLRAMGFSIHTSAGLALWEKSGDAYLASLTSGETHPFDLVLFSVGIRSNTALAEGGPKVDRGIVVDSHLATSIPDVWAAGDCVQVHGMTPGLWTAALEMGRIAGDNLAGGSAVYAKPTLFTNLRIGTIRIFSIGTQEGTSIWVQEDGANFVRIFRSAGKIVGGILYGNPSKMGMLQKWIGKEASDEDLAAQFA